MTASGPTPLRKADAALIAEILPALTFEQAHRLTKMTASHSRIIPGKRLKDGTLELQAMPHEQEGRRPGGIWEGYPRIAGGQYHRMLNYRLHPDGCRCGLGWGYCPSCTDLQADAPTADMKAKTRAAMAKQGGSALIPSTLLQAQKKAGKQAGRQAAPIPEAA